jgi:hypothetical protein
VPVFRAYVNDSGYYITARPSDVGNITYQTTAEADRFLTNLDYEDEDDLPWGLINPLRSAGLIYTEGEGVEADLDNAPDLDPEKLATLSAEEAEELLAYIESRKDLPEHVLAHLQDIISDREDGIAATISTAVEERFSNTRESVAVDWDDGHDSPAPRIDISLVVSRSMEDVLSSPDSKGEVEHFLYLDSVDGEERTITKWTVMHDFGEDWAGIARAYETKVGIMYAIENANEKLPFNLTWDRGPIGGYHV